MVTGKQIGLAVFVPIKLYLQNQEGLTRPKAWRCQTLMCPVGDLTLQYSNYLASSLHGGAFSIDPATLSVFHTEQ